MNFYKPQANSGRELASVFCLFCVLFYQGDRDVVALQLARRVLNKPVLEFCVIPLFFRGVLVNLYGFKNWIKLLSINRRSDGADSSNSN